MKEEFDALFAEHQKLLGELQAMRAVAQPEQDNTYGYASRLATAIWQKHYMKDAPKWKPLDTTEGVLTQIDNMTCGLVKEKPAQPEQSTMCGEPVALRHSFDGYGYLYTDMGFGSVWIEWTKRSHKDAEPLYTTPPQHTWVGLTKKEVHDLYDSDYVVFHQRIEAKLKEKNT